jgi:hypothetical protein
MVENDVVLRQAKEPKVPNIKHAGQSKESGHVGLGTPSLHLRTLA